MTGIYQIQSIIKPERIYIGSAINIDKRWAIHLSQLKTNKHNNNKIQRHYNKYGKDDLIFTVIEECSKDQLISKEQIYIDNLMPLFNICKKAGSVAGIKLSKESRLKISKSHTGKPISLETKIKISNSQKGKLSARYGKKHTKEALQKMRNKGMKGKHHTEETKEKIRKANLGELNPMRKKYIRDKNRFINK